MNKSTQDYQDTGMPDAMPAGSMHSSDAGGGGMPGGDMNAAAATAVTFASGEMPSGMMPSAESQDMPMGAMQQSSPAQEMHAEMPAAQAQDPGDASTGEMPGGGMVDTASTGMPMGAMLSAPGSAGWNMDLAPDQSCGC